MFEKVQITILNFEKKKKGASKAEKAKLEDGSNVAGMG